MHYKYRCVGQKTYGEEDTEVFAVTNNYREAVKICKEYAEGYVDVLVELNDK